MKKKIFMILVLAIMIFTLTGCNVTEKTSEDLFKELKKDKIIDKDYQFIDKVTEKGLGPVPHNHYYYVYENKNNDLILVEYLSDFSENEYNYTVKIYNKVELDNDIEFINIQDQGYGIFYCYSSEDKCSTSNKYQISYETGDSKNYLVYKKKFLIFKYYDIEEEK